MTIPKEAVDAAADAMSGVDAFDLRALAADILQAAAPYMMAHHPVLEAVEDVCGSYLGAGKPDLAGAAMERIIRLVSTDKEAAL